MREKNIEMVTESYVTANPEIRQRDFVAQFETAILAQEVGLKDHAQLMGMNKMLAESELMTLRYKLDLIAGQKEMVRWLNKGYFPAYKKCSIGS
jgi:hypothetical protein